jgi:hypothetical protein
MYIGLHGKCPLFLSDFKENLIFSTDFLKILKYQISRKTIKLERGSMRADVRAEVQIDKTKRIVAVRNFAKASKKDCSCYTLYVSL